MGVLDWIILAFILLFIYLGWRKGLMAAVVQFCGFSLTFLLVGHYYPLLQRSLLLKFHLARGLATLVSVVLIIVLVVVVLRLVVYILTQLLKALNLTTLNRSLGAVGGFANGLLIIIIFMVMLDFIPSLSTPLKNGEKHRVYAGVNVLKEELFTKFKLTERMKFIKMPHQLQRTESKGNSN
ncbi:MAG: CvpA family protein [Candidatus Cloacimonas sp.]|jgi:uncharacterized membrane protein required for colicin V production|nr:CvpA family protein [Candidatus Cloacimonas sp.]